MVVTLFQFILVFTLIKIFLMLPAVADTDCAGCHAEQVELWQMSDHARSMQVAEGAHVGASFDGEVVSYEGLTARFFEQDETYFVELTEPGDTGIYAIRYTFGYYPLQQYLIAKGEDRLQVVPFAWDSRDQDQGGQHWFHMEEARGEARFARFNWQQPLQNWNGMCADCHSSGLVRHYDVERDRFATQFSELNVGCLSCHTLPEQHETAATSRATSSPGGGWQRSPAEKVAHWVGQAGNHRLAMDTCFACHSLRAPLTDRFVPGELFLDHFTPEWIQPPFYQGDGQIAEEVYVYGSFQQSKMYAAGVSCLDCHDAHSNQLKVSGNGLCLQCHNPQIYDLEAHHRHEQGSTAAQCVTCHMPGKTYMGVDFRRDHRFAKPDPAVHQLTGSTDLCQDCHEDRWQQWMKSRKGSTALDEIDGPLISGRLMLNALRSGHQADPLLGFKLAQDAELNAIEQASALGMVSSQVIARRPDLLAAALTSSSDLLRLAAVQQAAYIPASLKPTMLAPLLEDARRAIRVAAARAMGSAIKKANPPGSAVHALKELDLSLAQSAWRGEGRLMLSAQALQLGDTSQAIKQLLKALDIDPFFIGIYLNLADIYRLTGDEAKVLETLDSGIKNISDAGPLLYSKALTLIRQEDYLGAVKQLQMASELDPLNPDYAFVRLLALQKVGRITQALALIESMPVSLQVEPRIKALARSLLAQQQ